MLDLTSREVSVPLSELNLFGHLTATYTATALVAPLSVEVSFAISGPAAPVYQPQELLPKFIIQFAPLRKIIVFVQDPMYLGLTAPVNITLEKVPDAGTVQVTAIPATMLGFASALVFSWAASGAGPGRAGGGGPAAGGGGDGQ